MSSKYDLDVRLAKRVTLNVAAIYLPTFKRADDGGNFQAAKTLLDKHNIGLNVWPAGGGKQSVNSLPLSLYDKPIAKNKDAYQQLVKDVSSWIKNRATGYPFLVPVIFCEFEARGVAITPHESKMGAATPVCLISMSAMTMKDKMTVLHEMGHAALYPDPSHDSTQPGNLMQDADGRTFLFRYQVEAFAKAYFAREIAPGAE
jgi:hypothetical protein